MTQQPSQEDEQKHKLAQRHKETLAAFHLFIASVAIQAAWDYKDMISAGDVLRSEPKTEDAKELKGMLDSSFYDMVSPMFPGIPIPHWSRWSKGDRCKRFIEQIGKGMEPDPILE